MVASKHSFAYKGCLGADMSAGLFESIEAIPANGSNQSGFKLGDQSYSLKADQDVLKKQGTRSAAILRQNMSDQERLAYLRC